MTLYQAMQQYGLSDKDRFECQYPEVQDKRPSSTFFADFCVADCYNEKAIEDTYNRAFNGWKDNLGMFTELVAVLNHKIWYWWQQNDSYAKLYDSLWRKANAYLNETFITNEEVEYWFKVLD